MVELDTNTSPSLPFPDSARERVEAIVGKHHGERGSLIALLDEIQEDFGYLPEDALRTVAELNGQSLVDIYGVARFYRSFSLEPRGKHLVSVCLGTACHVRGAPEIVGEICKCIGVGPGETTEDGEFSFQTVNCLGACALGPVAVADGHYFSKLKTSSVKSLVESTRRGLDRADSEDEKRVFPVVVSCPHCNHSLMDDGFSIEGRPSIRVTVAFDQYHGWLRLSSIYGRYNVYSEHEIPRGVIVDIFCPHCHAELRSTWLCPTCEAPMVTMIVRGGGVVRLCSRRGCCGTRSHMLDLR
jgi:NADH-quinone oxidoreductase subunit E